MRRVRSDADLAVACPLCHAKPWQPCVSTGGHGPMPGVIHRERKRRTEPGPCYGPGCDHISHREDDDGV